MIAKAVKGKGFRGALNYDLQKGHGRIIETNMAGENPRELAAEFGEIRKLRPTLGKAVLHVSLSASPGEKLTDAQWSDIAKHYLDGMGLEKNQFVVTRHTDTEHEHVHILANRIRFDGSVTSDSQDYRRQEVLMREIEREYGLERLAPSTEAERRPAVHPPAAPAAGRRSSQRQPQLYRLPRAPGSRRRGTGASHPAAGRKAVGPAVPPRRRDHERQRPGQRLQPGRAGKTRDYL